MYKEHIKRVLLLFLVAFLWLPGAFAAEKDYEGSRWDPIHFKPAIETATNEQCLACHGEILDRRVSPSSPAGVAADDTLAWYQTLEVYAGDQDTFHRRHLVTPLAQELMDLQCTFCHQGNDPREEAFLPDDSGDGSYTLRKMVNVETTCLRCHGQFDWEVMKSGGLQGPWSDDSVRKTWGGSCLSCHMAYRTNRHQVTYLKAEAIEAAGRENGDSCYGCHGGRAWYRIGYPYPRHEWPGMGKDVPDWAKDRPTESDERFRLPPQEEAPAAEETAETAAEPATEGEIIAALMTDQGYACLGCHQEAAPMVGPSYKEIAEKYTEDAEAVALLADKIKNGGVGTWGQIPMPPNSVSDEDMAEIVAWILSLAE